MFDRFKCWVKSTHLPEHFEPKPDVTLYEWFATTKIVFKDRTEATVYRHLQSDTLEEVDLPHPQEVVIDGVPHIQKKQWVHTDYGTEGSLKRLHYQAFCDRPDLTQPTCYYEQADGSVRLVRTESIEELVISVTKVEIDENELTESE